MVRNATVGDGSTAMHREARGGRGAVSNSSGRFEREQRVALDDGWGSLDAVPPPLRTRLIRDATRTVITRNQSPDIGFDRSINPYRGCEHGCIYCFARPTHAYLGFSPGLDFESQILFKPDAARLLEAELRAPSYRCAPIALGTNTDPYQPVEAQLELTRSILEVLETHGHPVTIVTKSARVTRDIDILARMARRRLAKVAISITTLDRRLAHAMEPRATTPERRLEAIRMLAQAGVPTGVMTAPVIPGLNEHEMDAILESAARAGATEAGYVLLRLPLEIKDLWQEWLAEHVPDRAARVMRLVRDMRGGRDYDASFGQRMTGGGPLASLLGQRFRLACRRLRLNQPRASLDSTAFRVPPQPGQQLDLLDPHRPAQATGMPQDLKTMP
ncbi:PA0069 family radical SAM protein [Zavarzinia sp. CC-PAN008]|uniref:PA0069 family radical SAM protein n=1 Tax=Zavarzinia sp. CC-PAN008 TaxID=3243332 RepID=UPI003F7438B9